MMKDGLARKIIMFVALMAKTYAYRKLDKKLKKINAAKVYRSV